MFIPLQMLHLLIIVLKIRSILMFGSFCVHEYFYTTYFPIGNRMIANKRYYYCYDYNRPA